MAKEVLDINKEYELLTPAAKRVWDKASVEITRIANEMNLSEKETHALLQRAMAEARYGDLQATNEYLSRTNEEYSQRAINKNKLEMQRMKRVHGDHYEDVKNCLSKVENELNRALNNKQKNK